MKIWGVFLAVACLLNAEDLRRAPGFSLPGMKLEQHDLMDYRGRIVLLDFIQTACPACIKLSGALEEVRAKFGDKVAILSVVNSPDNQATVARYVATNKVTSPVLFDCGQMTASYMKVLPDNPVVHFPQLFVIDGEGMIRTQSGADGNPAELEGKALIAQVEQLLQVAAKPKAK